MRNGIENGPCVECLEIRLPHGFTVDDLCWLFGAIQETCDIEEPEQIGWGWEWVEVCTEITADQGRRLLEAVRSHEWTVAPDYSELEVFGEVSA